MDDFRKYFLLFVPDDALMALRLATKAWKRVVDAFIDEGVESGRMIIHGGKNIVHYEDDRKALEERRALATRVIFFLNITKVGNYACIDAINLVVVDIPESVNSIGDDAFMYCYSLTTVSFPSTLTWIGIGALFNCAGLENVDLLHTNLQEFGLDAFNKCNKLKLMTIPYSLQTFGEHVFMHCSSLVPSNIDTSDNDVVVTHLRSQQSPVTT